MRSILMGLTVTISLTGAMVGSAFAQNSGMPQVVRGASADSKAKAAPATTQRAAHHLGHA